MALFQHKNRQKSAKSRRIFAIYELVYTTVDFMAAMFFVSGSIMFFFEDWQSTGTWMFLIGSILFATKPTLRFAREMQLKALGYDDDLAARFGK